MAVEAIPTGDPALAWHRSGSDLRLVYRDWPLIVITAEDDGAVGVRTRVYSEGAHATRRMATEAGALRYSEAWLQKWGAEAMAAIDGKWRQAEQARREREAYEAANPGGPPPDPRGRRRRK